MFYLLILNLLLFNFAESTIKELNSVKWSELGLRNVCPLDDFQFQFSKIKREFKKCLHFKHILFDVDFNSIESGSNLSQNDIDDMEEEKEIQKHFASISYSKNKLLNPFCKLSKRWNNCVQYIQPLNCIEANSKSLVPVYLPRTVQEQLRRIYEANAKQTRIMQSPDFLERFAHSGDRVQIKQEEEFRVKFHNRMRQLKFEQLEDYFKFRCDQRVNLHIDSLDINIPKESSPPAIDRFQQEAFSDI